MSTNEHVILTCVCKQATWSSPDRPNYSFR